MALGALIDTMKNRLTHARAVPDGAESAQDAAERAVTGARQGTDHSPTSAGKAADDAAGRARDQAAHGPRKSTDDPKLVSGDATDNDPGRGTLREDEL